MFRTPVALFIWRRPEETARVFAEIAKAQPETLLIVADGPRTLEEADACQAARTVTEEVDWDCEVIRNYASENLGCRGRMSTGIDWVFEQVEEAILLEDDCLPHPSFFPYCEALLEKYRDEPKVMAIVGASSLPENYKSPHSYYFSHFLHMWGWASWRSAWRHYDVEMSHWEEIRNSGMLKNIWGDPIVAGFWRHVLDRTYAGDIDTWDYQWMYSFWRQGGLVATPNLNLISNIGYGPLAAHTKNEQGENANLPSFDIKFPLVHPPKIEHDPQASSHYYKVWERKAYKWHTPIKERLRKKAKELFHKIVGS